MISLRPATKYHARVLGREMRAEDRAEILASGNWSEPERCVRANINRSLEAYAVYADSDLLAIFGVLRGRDGWFVPWALTSVHVQKHQLQFWKASRTALETLRSRYPDMVQMVHAKYDAALRWLKRLGFTVEPPVPFGPRGEMFCRVQCVTREVVCATR